MALPPPFNSPSNNISSPLSFSPFTPISSPDHTAPKRQTSHTQSYPQSHSTTDSNPQSQPRSVSQSTTTSSPRSPDLPTPPPIPGSRVITWTTTQSSSSTLPSLPASTAFRLLEGEREGLAGHGSGAWRSSSGGLGLAGMNHTSADRSESFRPGRRVALGEVNLNSTSTPSLGLASPFVPADPNGLWGPPSPPSRMSSHQTVEERLAEAEEKIKRLTLENQQLKENRQPSYTVPYLSPVHSPASPTFADSVTQPGYGGYIPPRLLHDDPLLPSYGSQSPLIDPRPELTGESTPSPALVKSVLHGTFDYSQMHAEYIRPIVWVVANCPPRTNGESIGLKTAVNALAARLMLPRDSEPAVVLVDAVLEWAKPLCFTSCGNYLCQQLLEKAEGDDKKRFIDEIKDDLVAIASDKFGTHVLCKAVAVKELENSISEALIEHGIFESFKTGARRLWREYLERCRLQHNFDVFISINEAMFGKWAELACANEHGSIAVQQVFEVFGSQELMEPCFREILAEVARVANSQYGHYVITKLIQYPPLYRPTCDAILCAYPPVATSHHGVNFAKIALTEGGRASIVKYIDAICSTEDGFLSKTPGIVSIATSSIGKAHLTFVLSCLTPAEHVRVRQVCRAFSTTLRNSQSGNDLLRSLGLIHAIGARHRLGHA